MFLLIHTCPLKCREPDKRGSSPPDALHPNSIINAMQPHFLTSSTTVSIYKHGPDCSAQLGQQELCLACEGAASTDARFAERLARPPADCECTCPISRETTLTADRL